MNKRIVYVDLLRIITAFFIVLIHVVKDDFWGKPITSTEWELANFYSSMSKWGTQVFMMISGMFFLNLNRKITYQSIYRKSVLKFIIILLFWNIIYSILRFYSNNEQIWSLNYIFKHIILGASFYHLWFLYVLLGFYMITPLIRVFLSASKEKDIKYFMILYMSTVALIPILNYFLAIYTTGIKIVFNIVELEGFTIYLIAGYYFSQYEISLRLKRIIYIFGIFSLIITFFLIKFSSSIAGEPVNYFYIRTWINMIFISFSVFLFIKDIGNKLKLNEKTLKKLQYFANATLGIYLIHPFYIKILEPYFDNYLFPKNIFTIPIYTLIYYILSLATTIILKKIPILGKRIV